MSSSSFKKKWILLFGLFLVCSVFGFAFFTAVSNKISPQEDTYTSIGETFYRIHLYMISEGDIPDSLEQLAKRDGYRNKTTDYWNRPLIYSISENGVLSLSSLGADGIPGGSGNDADLSRMYRTRDENGNSTILDDLWIVTSEIHPPHITRPASP